MSDLRDTQAVLDITAVALAEWLQDRYGETGAYLETDPTDDGWVTAGRALIDLVERGAQLDGYKRPMFKNVRAALHRNPR